MSTGINSNSTIVKIDDLLETELENEVIIMHVKSGRYLDMKGVTADIWKRLKQPIQVSDLLESLMLEYDVSESVCEQDVLAVLAQMTEADIITVTNA